MLAIKVTKKRHIFKTLKIVKQQREHFTTFVYLLFGFNATTYQYEIQISYIRALYSNL